MSSPFGRPVPKDLDTKRAARQSGARPGGLTPVKAFAEFLARRPAPSGGLFSPSRAEGQIPTCLRKAEIAMVAPDRRNVSPHRSAREARSMEKFIDRLIREFESGALGRREFCQMLGIATAIYAAGGAQANAAPSGRGLKGLGVNHVSYLCPDYTKAR